MAILSDQKLFQTSSISPFGWFSVEFTLHFSQFYPWGGGGYSHVKGTIQGCGMCHSTTGSLVLQNKILKHGSHFELKNSLTWSRLHKMPLKLCAFLLQNDKFLNISTFFCQKVPLKPCVWVLRRQRHTPSKLNLSTLGRILSQRWFPETIIPRYYSLRWFHWSMNI